MTGTVLSNIIQKLCTKVGSEFKELTQQKKTIQFNIYEEYKGVSTNIGSGSFGKVKELNFPDKEVADKVAAKYAVITDNHEMELADVELKVMNMMNNLPKKIGPYLYGCQYGQSGDKTKKKIHLFVVQEKLMASMLEEHVYMKSLSNLTFIQIAYEVVLRIYRLWEAGFAHSDIKPDNIMFNENHQKIYLIDFNLAEPISETRFVRGTPGYLAPPLWKSEGNIEQRDDMYSWALTMTGVLAKHLEFTLFNGFDKNIVKGVNCDRRWDHACRDILITNIKGILGDRFGADESDNDDKYNNKQLNFLSLVLRIVKWEQFHYSYKDLLDNLNFLIEQEKAKKELAEKMEQVQIESKPQSEETKQGSSQFQKRILSNYIKAIELDTFSRDNIEAQFKIIPDSDIALYKRNNDVIYEKRKANSVIVPKQSDAKNDFYSFWDSIEPNVKNVDDSQQVTTSRFNSVTTHNRLKSPVTKIKI